MVFKTHLLYIIKFLNPSLSLINYHCLSATTKVFQQLSVSFIVIQWPPRSFPRISAPTNILHYHLVPTSVYQPLSGSINSFQHPSQSFMDLQGLPASFTVFQGLSRSSSILHSLSGTYNVFKQISQYINNCLSDLQLSSTLPLVVARGVDYNIVHPVLSYIILLMINRPISYIILSYT